MTDLAADLANRWRPTDEQIARADAVAAVTGEATYTLHLLVNKTYGIWTDDVDVVALDGVFTDRATAFKVLASLTRDFAETYKATVTGGYARHSTKGNWAVWDDIMSEFIDGRSA